MTTYTIINGTFATVQHDTIVPVFGNAVIQNGMITKIVPSESYTNIEDAQTLQQHQPVIDAGGRVITIPLTNFHDHIYSRLAKGLPLSGDFSNFENILKNLWWKLDSFLDLPMIAASAKLTAIESIRNGVTYIVDHHSSQTHAKDSLGSIRSELESAGLRSILCFETSCRNGKEAAEAGLKENMDYLLSDDPNHKALFGLHASFTLDEETLALVGNFVNEHQAGIHIHLYEDHADRKNTNALYAASPVDRLIKHKLLNKKSILAHGLFLESAELEKLIEYQPALVLNVDSNMNNAVGLPPYRIGLQNLPMLAGTDGMHANLAKSLKQIFLSARVQGVPTGDVFGLIQHIYFGQIKYIQQFFPAFSRLTENSQADFVIWDYIPPTPLNKDNFWGHYIYGVLESPVHSVVQGGKFLMKNYSLTNIDEVAACKEIYAQGERLYAMFAETL